MFENAKEMCSSNIQAFVTLSANVMPALHKEKAPPHPPNNDQEQ